MPNGDIFPYHQSATFEVMFGSVGQVQHATVLDPAARADHYRIDVTADGDQLSDADVVGQLNFADHHAGRNIMTR